MKLKTLKDCKNLEEGKYEIIAKAEDWEINVK